MIGLNKSQVMSYLDGECSEDLAYAIAKIIVKNNEKIEEEIPKVLAKKYTNELYKQGKKF